MVLARRLIRMVGVALILPLTIFAAWNFLELRPALPFPYEPEKAQLQIEAAASTLTALTQFIMTIDLSLIALAAVLIKYAGNASPKADIANWIVAILACQGSVIALFLGYRFEIDLASQLSDYRFNFRAIGDRVAYQATFSLISASLLLALAIDRHSPITATKEARLWFG